MPLKPSDKKALEDIARKLGSTPRRLALLINFESSWNPTIKNPRSSARGLIQFMDKTAKRMGYRGSLDLVQQHPTIQSQLRGPVYDYLRPMAPFPTDQSLFMAVFYPKARTWLPGRQFPENVKRVNPGIKTPADYVRKVYIRSGLTYAPPALFLILAGSLLYFTFKRKGAKHGNKKEKGK